ncbi:topoisomerase [Halobacillus sp. MO56]
MVMKRVDVIKYVKENEGRALKKASEILSKETSIQSFNGIVGGKNATYSVDPLEYETAESYIEDWMRSHHKRYNDEKNFSYRKSSHRVHDLLKDSFVKNYIENYLARTFFNKHERIN